MVEGDGGNCQVQNVGELDLNKVYFGESREFEIVGDLSIYSVEIYINGKQLFINGKVIKVDNIDEDMLIQIVFSKKSFFETKLGIITIISGIAAVVLLIAGLAISRKIKNKRRQRLI